jgi:hypothetical protein
MIGGSNSAGTNTQSAHLARCERVGGNSNSSSIKAPSKFQPSFNPGGAWQFLESQGEEKSVGFEGEYLVIEPGKRLVFTWSQVIAYAGGERESIPYSQVEIIFTVHGQGTE